ncbi:MAG: tryptophan 7-halogenase [bacterium]|nr:tryptophan 7-halogenase [bacterium]
MEEHIPDADIVFVGGGISAQLISRYLKIKFPNKRITILERNTHGKWSPGESTVGVAGLFLIRDLGLSTYCYLNHLPKNGLRYFFQNEEQNFDVEQCSEIGSNIFPVFPTFQIDRKRFSEDLWKMNSDLGIQIKLGAEVQDCKINKNDQLNNVSYRFNGSYHSLNCDWLIHATGRSGKILPNLHSKNPVIDDEDHPISAAWGRYTKVGDLDLQGSKSWRKRVGYTSRYLSTIHCMGKGYWIWIIPIGNNVISFGVVYDRQVIEQNLNCSGTNLNELIKSSSGFDKFIRQNKVISNLLENAEMLDFQSAEQLSYRREKFCHTDHWAFIGESFGFIDPFYSPGSDVISRQAYLLEHLLNSKEDKLQKEVSIVNQYCHYEFDLIRELYVGQYEGFGSFDVFNIKGLWDFHTYSNRMIWNFYDERFKDMGFIKREVDAAPVTLKLTRAIQQGFRTLSKYLQETGTYYNHNRDLYSLRQNRFRNEEDILLHYDEARSLEEHLHICQLCICEMLNIRFNLSGLEQLGFIQENLNFSVMQTFELNTKWMTSFCQRLAKTLSRHIWRQFNIKLEFSIQIEDFHLDIPQSVSKSVPQDLPEREKIVEVIRALWTNPSNNRVIDELVTVP